MKHPWKKNFRKIPEYMIVDLNKTKGDKVQVCCIKEILQNDIKLGLYKHIGIAFLEGQIQFENEILPSQYVGRYSRYNLLGREIKRTDLPKVPFSYDTEAPNYNGNGTHSVTHDIMKWARENWLPQYLSIKITVLEEKQSSFIFKFEIDSILDRKDKNFENELLYQINLLQENCGKANVFDTDMKEEDYIKTLYVDWELLPPGIGNLRNNINIILQKFRNITPELEIIVKDRMEFFESLEPQQYIYGTNSFNHYFGAKLKNDIVLFENVKYGNAVYIFYEDWQVLSKMSRTELLNSKNRKFERVKHTPNWKYFVKAAINN